MSVEKAVESLKNGKMIIVYDGDEREGEADLIYSAGFSNPEKIERLRKDAGGLICAAIRSEDASRIGLPFFTDLLELGTVREISCKKTAYGDRPAFSIPINHNGVYTGITDEDRSLTMRKLAEVITERIDDFSKEFYSPGHIFLLIGRGGFRGQG